MKTKYLLLKPAKVDSKALLSMDDEVDDSSWQLRARDLQERRWHKINRRLNQENTA